jgi:NAD(P)H-flavin reductase
MIRFTLMRLKELGFADNQIVTTLENKMKCGLGKCARCNVGDKYVCRDGPVFTFEQISKFIEQI